MTVVSVVVASYSQESAFTPIDKNLYPNNMTMVIQLMDGDAEVNTAEVAAFVEQHKDKNIILCGDFNDTPVSYSHYQLGKNLKDCYVATANGLGRTYNRYAMLVRIDHILCSPHFWKPYSCHIDNQVNYSDHYPIICYLQRVMK